MAPDPILEFRPGPRRRAAGMAGRWAWRSACAGLLALAGCAGFVPQPGPDPEPNGRYQLLTTPIVALADTQEHLATGFPLHDNDSAIDAFVEVTQRPPEQPLFGRRVLEWVLHQHPDEPFLHLGDVLDLSCKIEGKRVAAAFKSTPSAGAILPGNHDGLMFGIFGYNALDAVLDPDATKWHRACRRGADSTDTARRGSNEALTKREFITGYLAGLASGPRPKPGLTVPEADGEVRIRWRNPDPNAYLSAIEARLFDGQQYADSFLAQRLRLPRAPGATREVLIIGLDTNQAGALVSTWDTILGHSPGSVGHVNADQVLAINGWVSEAIRQGQIVVFAGHHNWQALGLPSRTLLRGLMSRLDHPLVYLSAHTHSGFWATHRVLSRKPLLELNISSLSDWPIAYRRISFAYDEVGRRLQVRAPLLPQREAEVASYADLHGAWEDRACKDSGVATELIRQGDREVVQQQRASRGGLMAWLLQALQPACETCEQPLYEHGQAYQNAMLLALLQARAHLSGLEPMPDPPLPAWCGGQDFEGCAGALLAEQPVGFAAHTDLFRRKAGLVASLNDHLDSLANPRAKAYMACRAVQAAKLDFDDTDDSRNEHRGEAKRRAEHLFDATVSVGMQ